MPATTTLRPFSTAFSRALGAALAVGLVGCGHAGGPSGVGPARWLAEAEARAAQPVARPEGCTEVAAGADLQAAIEGASEGASLCLGDGAYQGPVRIRRRIALWGRRGAVIVSSGQGTTVSVEAAGTRLLGFTVSGSGGRMDTLDAAVHVVADDVEVAGLRVEQATFGILLEKANRALVRRCLVVGERAAPRGLRGDGIRLWETRDSVVEECVVRDSRDVVVWYSPRNVLRRNTVVDGRYGTHCMYSSGLRLEDNRYLGDVVGTFVMYSNDVDLEHNVFAGGAGAAGMGLGIKESGDLRVRRNLFVRNTIGVYLDTSPLQEGEHDLFEDNLLRLHDTAVVFHGRSDRNTFRRNSLRDNRAQVTVEGGGDALASTWEGNEFDDYVGYDLDGDGTGDVPYELRSLSGDLASRYPALRLFDGTPALTLVDVVSHIAPLFRPTTVIADPRPRLSAAQSAEVLGAR